jgi:hypothetical protein
MLSFRTRTGLAVLLTAFVLCVPAAAFEPQVSDSKKPDSEKLDDIARQLREIRKDLDLLRPYETALTIETLRKQMSQVQDRLSNLEQRVNQTTISGSFDPSRRIMASPTMTGTVRLQNRSGYLATVTVNGFSYTLVPGELRFVNGVPVGELVYQVSATGCGTIQPPTFRNLAPGETLNLTINP